jgi:hypothetical protein
MKKTIAKKTLSKKAQPKKKKNVVAFKKPKEQPQKPTAPQPKVHPFAAFMKDRWSARNFSGHARKMGSQDTYRKKAV